MNKNYREIYMLGILTFLLMFGALIAAIALKEQELESMPASLKDALMYPPSGPFIGGLIADRYGFGTSFAVAGATVIVIALIFLPFLIRIGRKNKFLA